MVTSNNRISFRDLENLKGCQIRWYGITRRLVDTACVISEPSDEEEWSEDWNVSLQTLKATNKLLKFQGVAAVRVDRFEMRVALASVFDFNEIHEAIVKIISEEYFPNEDYTTSQTTKEIS